VLGRALLPFGPHRFSRTLRLLRLLLELPRSSYADPIGGFAVFVCCWSAKGGVGTTVVAAALALVASSRDPVVLVDLAGDLPAVLGVGEPDGPGVAEWSRRGCFDPVSPLCVPVTGALRLLPRGRGPIDAVVPERLPRVATVVVDAGVIDDGDTAAASFVASAGRSLLVTRACYVALRRATRLRIRPDGVVLVSEPGRALTARDVAGVIGAPVVAEIPVDAHVSRAVDAGLLAARCPAELARPLAMASR
jgi:hypothetical protein